MSKNFTDSFPKVIWSGDFKGAPSNEAICMEIPLVSGMTMAHSNVIIENEVIGYIMIHTCKPGNFRKLAAIKIQDGKDSEFTGRSMEPFIKIGDVICIDRSDRIVKRMAICAVRRKNGSVIRKVERSGNILVISSESGDVENIDPDDPNPIIGKGIWTWRSLR